MVTDLAKLARPFKPSLIHTNPSGGGSYVKHSVVVQKVLAVCGPYDWHVVQVIRGDVAHIPPNPDGKSAKARAGSHALTDAIVGCIGRLSLTVDGKYLEVEGAGDCEQPHNWPHDGARLKDAESDAFKRAAMKVGVGLHLWAQDEFFLYEALSVPMAGEGERVSGPAPGSERAIPLAGEVDGTGADTRETTGGVKDTAPSTKPGGPKR